ncbi:membrane protein [Minicystis rosea]|nr:membrane protein [Minicystis rosea]
MRKNVAWATVVVVALLTVFLGARATRVERDDDLLAFLPKSNPDIQVFQDVNKRFGGLGVALVGIATEDALAPEFLGKLKQVTKQLNETKGVDYAFSLANVDDFTPDPEKGGIGVDYLIPSQLPKTPAEQTALREKVMSREQVVGNLVSKDGKAALIYCFLSYGADPKESAATVRTVVEGTFTGAGKYWGGAPFIQSYIFSVTQKDLERLTPWACIVILAISVWAFRDTVGTILALFTTAAGIAVALGLMATFGVKTNLVLGSMPVILFALGSAYPIHILTRYYAVVGRMGRDKAIEHAIVYLGPTVIASGLTTVGGLLSFVVMDIDPIRTFGLFTGLGVLFTLVLSVTFVPAVIRLADLKARLDLANHTSRGMVWLSTRMATHRVAVGGSLAVLALLGSLFVSRIDSRVDNASFYTRTSPPAQAETFMRDHFGGSQFFQVHVEGDMTDPDVLRSVRDLADRISVLPHVTSVNHISVVIAKMNEAMEGDERVPDTAAKVKLLYGFLAGRKAVSQLVTDDRAHALLMVKVDTDRADELETVLADVERTVTAAMPKRFVVADVTGPRKDDVRTAVESLVSTRIHAIAAQHGVPFPKAQADAVAQKIHDRGARKPADPKPIEAAILAFLKSEEFTGELPKSPADAQQRVVTALAGLSSPPSKEALAAAIASAIEKPEGDAAVLDLAAAVRKPVAEILRRQVALSDARRLVADAGLALPAGDQGQRFVAAIGAALMDLDITQIILPASPAASDAKTMAVTVTGQPVLNRGLSRSVDQNQLKSFFLAMGLVLIIVLVLYRSFWSALLAMAPVTMTLLVVYGGMGFLGVHLDIGTSMLASLTTGAGVDYAVHLLAAWKGPPGTGKPDKAALRGAAAYSAFLVGRAIWTNALMVAGGFVVLTMGEARPLQNVGMLTAVAMMAAALATFAAIAAFARRRSYDDRPRITEILPSSDAAEGALFADDEPSPSIARGSS